jgi:NNP family nitrate/nitrite transporter-like MFS transporter
MTATQGHAALEAETATTGSAVPTTAIDASPGKATRIRLSDFSSPPMRAFHMAWLAFFLCFFAWFGIAPLMSVVRDELRLTQEQLGWCIIGSVAITVLARLAVGWLCDRVGPRLTYCWLLILGSLPVMGIGLAHDFTSFLIFRMLIGAIGASFVITQYHTSMMFASNCVGTANATTAGWGNLGGGAAQIVMPCLMAMLTGVLGLNASLGWRLAMVIAGLLCAATGVAYYLLTQDTPEGNFSQLRREGRMPASQSAKGSFVAACRDYRVWILFAAYGACFGIELTINNVAALYFVDHFAYFRTMQPMEAMTIAGMCAGLFGLMNLFARTLGGYVGDRCGIRWGLGGRTRWLFAALAVEGVWLMVFSQQSALSLALPAMLLFSLFVQMAEGATFAVVPFINRQALGPISGLVGAGGNAGAVAAGFLFKSSALSWPTALLILGALVTACSFLCLAVTFSPAEERDAQAATAASLAARQATSRHMPMLSGQPVVATEST